MLGSPYLLARIVFASALIGIPLSSPRAAEPRQIPTEDSPSLGPDGAPVVLVGFEDFQCSACVRAAPTVKRLLAAHPGGLRFVFRNFPLESAHPRAIPAARAAWAAGRQGKFWEMHDALFANQKLLDEEGLRQLAHGVGLDVERFDADRNSEEAAAAVERDLERGEKLGVLGTPTFFVNGVMAESSSFDTLAPMIERELARD